MKLHRSLGRVGQRSEKYISGVCLITCVYVILLAAFDIRLPPTTDQAQFESIIQRWCSDAGPDVSYQFILVSHWVLCIGAVM